jgi:tRNA1Val (adenine37-N6)-methyltransferase
MAKSDPYFRFKQFVIDHSRATMKVGTDGVLLGAWTKIHNAKTILDIGTGSGVIALMLAQRSGKDTLIDAVEIEREDADLANENVKNSPWSTKIKVFCHPVQEFNPGIRYDLIVSNPPFFSNSWAPPDQRRYQTRHTTSLSFSELIAASDRLLKEDGRLNVVLPVAESNHFIKTAESKGLYNSRRWSFRTRPGKPVERWLLEFSRIKITLDEGEILHYQSGNEWSEVYKTLTRDFYLYT